MGELNIAAGQQIGRYKLLQKIGEGGFGVVFMAEQSASRSPQSRAEGHQAGHGLASVIARFEAERQALALMDHPNIARVLGWRRHRSGSTLLRDGTGARASRSPSTATRTNFDTEERLHLFVTVCQAVQHAHQKGIIHRDLKAVATCWSRLHDGKPWSKSLTSASPRPSISS